MRFQELKERAASAWRMLRGHDGNLVAHARSELQALGYYDGDHMNAVMAANLIESVRMFSTQGHSGMSAAFALSVLKALLAFEPLGPLTGADSEWVEVSDGLWQNKRCGRVFKEADGRAYDIDGTVWQDSDDVGFTNFRSRVYVTFPYTPKTEYRPAIAEAI